MKNMHRLPVFALAMMALAIFLLSACGFQLQARVELPPEMQQTRLEVVDPYGRFAQRLETLLEQNGIQVVESGDSAAILEVPLNNVRKEIQSIGDNARVQEFLIRHSVQFRLLDKDGKEMIPLQSFEQSRVYSFNEQDILAAEREDEFLRNDLADNLAGMVVRRIGTYGK